MTGSPFEGICGGLHEGGVHADGTRRVTTVGPEIAKLDRIAGIVGDVETTMFVTSSTWGRVARELEILTRQPNPENFRRLRLRNLTIVNSTSEDQEAVNLLNVPEAKKCGFAWKRDNYITGKA